MTDNTEITTPNAELASTPEWMQPQNLDQALALADRIAASGLVPDHLRDNPGGILLIIDQAQRWGMSPLAVAQGTSIVHGKLCYEGKLVHAALVSMGAIRAPLRYDYAGEERSTQRTITVSGTLPDGTERSITGSVEDWLTVSKNKSGQNVSPWAKASNYDKMLAYRGAREWARLYAPAAMLGVYTPDEMAEVKDADVIDPAPAVRREAPPQQDASAGSTGPTGQTSELGTRSPTSPPDTDVITIDDCKVVAREIMEMPGGYDALTTIKHDIGLSSDQTYDDAESVGINPAKLKAKLDVAKHNLEQEQ